MLFRSRALGTDAGGWRIIRTMGKGITDIESPQGFAAETSAATTLLLSSHLGFALSSTHVVSGSVVGVGLGRRLNEVRWGVAGQMVIAWALTLPAAAAVGAGGAMLTSYGTPGVIAVAAVAAVLGGGLYLASRRNPVNARNINGDTSVEQTAQPTAAVAN